MFIHWASNVFIPPTACLFCTMLLCMQMQVSVKMATVCKNVSVVEEAVGVSTCKGSGVFGLFIHSWSEYTEGDYTGPEIGLP